MKNITLAVDDNVLDGVRRYAIDHGTTVNGLIRDHFQRIVDQGDRAAQARRELAELSDRSTGRLGPDWKWNRAELYDRPILRRYERPDLRRDGEIGESRKKKSSKRTD